MLRLRFIFSFLFVLYLCVFGCNASPIPRDIELWHNIAKKEVPRIRSVVQPGDIIFRVSSTRLLGFIDFSQIVAEASESDFSHAVLVYKVESDGVILVDITEKGITRRYLVDWYLDPSKKVVVTRLKIQYRYLIPKILEQAKKVIKEDGLYDDNFSDENDKYYCTEVVDKCFREAGFPLANKVKIKDLKRHQIFISMACSLMGVNLDQEIVIAGNERWGLFSSPMLKIVLDLR